MALSSPDPDAINTSSELAAALDDLRHVRGLSYSGLDRAARDLPTKPGRARRLPKSTVGDILNGRPPAQDTLLTFLAACGVVEPDLTHWLAAGQRAQRVALVQPVGKCPVKSANLRSLGIHESMELPTYIPRDIDDDLAISLNRARTNGGFILLVGGSCVGKSRSAYEAIRKNLPEWWLCHPESVSEIDELSITIGSNTVIWLDEVQYYIDEKFSASLMRRLLGSSGPAVVIGTIWTSSYLRYTSLPESGAKDRYSRERELLKLAHAIDVPAAFSAAELFRAGEVAKTDPHIRASLSSSDYGVTQILAAAPQLVRRWESAPNPYAQAVITAAIDARRVGINSPLTYKFFSIVAMGYITAAEIAEAKEDWLDSALAYATEKILGATAALARIPGREMGSISGYRIADYLLQYGLYARHGNVPPDSAWMGYMEVCNSNPNELARIADAAYEMKLASRAETFYGRAIERGEEDAVVPLAAVLAEEGRLHEALTICRAAAHRGNPDVRIILVSILTALGETGEARRVCEIAAANGDQDAKFWLLGLS